MQKVGLPIGLIRYTSQDELEGKPTGLLRARNSYLLCAYRGPSWIVRLHTVHKVCVRCQSLSRRRSTLLDFENKQVQNNFKIRLVNRSQIPQEYLLAPSDDQIVAHWSAGEKLTLETGRKRYWL